jgi:hypothetical protein
MLDRKQVLTILCKQRTIINKLQDYDFYVTIIDGHVTIFQIRLQTLIKLINENYNYTPASFINGDLQNTATENQGSAKLFCFGVVSCQRS